MIFRVANIYSELLYFLYSISLQYVKIHYYPYITAVLLKPCISIFWDFFTILISHPLCLLLCPTNEIYKIMCFSTLTTVFNHSKKDQFLILFPQKQSKDFWKDSDDIQSNYFLYSISVQYTKKDLLGFYREEIQRQYGKTTSIPSIIYEKASYLDFRLYNSLPYKRSMRIHFNSLFLLCYRNVPLIPPFTQPL